MCPAHYSVGSKNVARKVLQALELLKMVEKDPNGYVYILGLYSCNYLIEFRACFIDSMFSSSPF